jgi:hypothetical protein
VEQFLREAEQFLREAEQEVLYRREKVGGLEELLNHHAHPPTGSRSFPKGGGTGGSSTGEKRWVEIHIPLLTLLQEAEQFLREAEQEVLNRREKVGGAPESPFSPSYKRRSSSSGRRTRKSSTGEKSWVELHSPLLTFLQEAELFLREAEQFPMEAEQFLREAKQFLR